VSAGWVGVGVDRMGVGPVGCYRLDSHNTARLDVASAHLFFSIAPSSLTPCSSGDATSLRLSREGTSCSYNGSSRSTFR
jgi:hypothetical protein